MRRSLPIFLVATGLTFLVGGFVYDVAFAGIPYPDPTPAMAAEYAHHARVASLIRWAGALVVLAGSAASFVRRPRTPSAAVGGARGGVGQGCTVTDAPSATAPSRLTVRERY